MIVPAPYAVLLAAGAGTRFGGRKLSARWRGRTIVEHVVSSIKAAIEARDLAGLIAVIPPHPDFQLQADPQSRVSVITNPDAARGLSGSLQLGLHALAQPDVTPRAMAALIVLADQPMLRHEVIRSLVADWRSNGRSVRPRYSATPEVPGHPVLVTREDWSLADLSTGDSGLGALLSSIPGGIRLLDVSGMNPDIDTREDLAQLDRDA
ncbi:MAG: nucleotidyltransferase family protein [Gemmatimonadota bacterium]